MNTFMVDMTDPSNSSGGVLINLEDSLREEKSKSQTQSYQPFSLPGQASSSLSFYLYLYWILVMTRMMCPDLEIPESCRVLDVGMGDLGRYGAGLVG